MPNSTVHARSDTLLALGGAIRKLREAKGMAQEEFALWTGLDRSYVGRIERAENSPSVIALVQIADALDISVSELMAEAGL